MRVCACARAAEHTKIKNTKFYSQGVLVNDTKNCINENFPLYGNVKVKSVVYYVLQSFTGLLICNMSVQSTILSLFSYYILLM